MKIGGPSPVVGPDSTSEIALVNLDGSDFEQVTSDGKLKFLPHLSPDGTKIVYTKFAVGGYAAPDARYDVAVLDVATRTETMVTNGGRNGYGVWSPDGSRIAYVAGATLDADMSKPTAIYTVGADGSGAEEVARASGMADDMFWPGDIYWSSDDRILFVVAQNVGGCFKPRIDTIRPDGSERTKVTDGGPSCTQPSFESAGDADPGWSHDGTIIYTSRGLPRSPPGAPATNPPYPTVRRLFAVSADAWSPAKQELDLSLPSAPDCIEAAPRGSPDGSRILVGRLCFENGAPVRAGGYVTDTRGTYRQFVAEGFGHDWNPAAR